jgi:hypothetical protein
MWRCGGRGLARVLSTERLLVGKSCAHVIWATCRAPSELKMIVGEDSRGNRPPRLTGPELVENPLGDPGGRKPDLGIEFRVPVSICRLQLCLARAHGSSLQRSSPPLTVGRPLPGGGERNHAAGSRRASSRPLQAAQSGRLPVPFLRSSTGIRRPTGQVFTRWYTSSNGLWYVSSFNQRPPNGFQAINAAGSRKRKGGPNAMAVPREAGLQSAPRWPDTSGS